MAKSTIRVGFIGAGRMGQMAHLANYATIKDCEIVALAELREKTGQSVALRYGIPRYYKEASEMLVREQLDAIVAIQNFSQNGVLLSEVLKFGKPVLIEKPLAHSLQVGEQIVRLVKENGTFLMVGYHKRSDPATMYAKTEIEKIKSSGRMGRMRYIRLVMPPGDWVAHGFDAVIDEHDEEPVLESDPPPQDMDEELFQKYLWFVNYYIHQVNLMRHLLGESFRPVFTDKAGVLFVGESESGVTCTIELDPYTTSIDWQEQALVCFDQGWVKLDLPAPLACNRAGRVHIFHDPGKEATPMHSSPVLPLVGAMKQQAVNFMSAVRGERSPTTDAAEAFEDLRVAREYIRLSMGR